MKTIYSIFAFPLILNAIAWYFKWDYLVSVNFVLGGITLLLTLNSIKVFTKNDWKLFGGISVFSNIFTFFVEVIMLKFDVWGFSSQHTRLLGITAFGAPIEEYIFWMYCPWLVGFTYIICARSGIDKTIDPKLLTLITKPLAKLEELKKAAIQDEVKYTSDTTTSGQYSRGNKFPVYLSIQLILLGMVVYLKKLYHGSWRSMLLTLGLFFFTMMPYEQYAISQGFWTYNANKMIGLFFLKVPFEGWLMYILPPIAGAMFTDVCSRKFFGKDI